MATVRTRVREAVRGARCAALAAVFAGCVGDDGVVGGRRAADDVSLPRRACAAGETDVACCPTGWLPAEGGGCAPPRVVCVGTRATSPECTRALEHPRDETERFWAWDAQRRERPWFQPWTCPQGWTALPDGSCRSALGVSCPAGEMATPDGACTETGERVCGSAEFPEAPSDATRVVYVRAGQPDDAPGTRDAPVGSLAHALDLAGDGGAVLLTDGVYALTRNFTGRATILGRCPARVTLHRASPSIYDYVVRATGPAARVRVEGVTIADYERALEAYEGAEVFARRVVLQSYHLAVLSFTGGRVRVEQAVIRESPVRPDEYTLSLLLTGGTIELDHVVLEGGGRPFGHERSEDNNLTMRHVSIVRPKFKAPFAGNLILDDVRIESPGETRALELRGTLQADGLHMWYPTSVDAFWIIGAIYLGGGMHATMRRVRFDGWAAQAIQTSAVAELDLEDIAIVSDSTNDGGARGGIELVSTVAHGRRIQVRNATAIALAASALSRVDLEDVWIRRNRAPATGDFSIGIGHAVGGSMTVRRASIDDMPMAAIAVANLPREIFIDDPVATARINPELRARAALVGSQSTRVEFTDVTTSMVQPPPSVPGAAIVAASNSTLYLQRAALYNTYGVGLVSCGLATERYFAVRALAAGTTLIQTWDSVWVMLEPLVRPRLTGPAFLDAEGLYLGPVRPGGVFLSNSSQPTAVARTASWAASASDASALHLRDALLVGSPGAQMGVVSAGDVLLQRSIVRDFPRCPTALSTVTRDATIRADGSRIAGARCNTNEVVGFELPLSSP